MPPRSSITLLHLLLLLLITRCGPVCARAQMQAGVDQADQLGSHGRLHHHHHTARHQHDPLRWVWVEDASLRMAWPSRFSLSINGAVTAYRLSLTHPHHHQPFATTTMYHATTLKHQFEGLASNVTYSGQLAALVGQNHWPYNLLNFTIASPTLLTGLGLGQRAVYGRTVSTIADLTSITVAVRLRWSPTPFLTGGFTPLSSEPADPPEPAVRPLGYRLRVWDHKHLVTEVVTSVSGRDKGCEASVGGMKLDTVYKATLEALLADQEPGTSLSFSLDAGSLHVAGGGLTTDGVSECYSGLQVRCPGSERCVSPYWICDGAPDCPDGVDEVGCDTTKCDGFKCWDEVCISEAWRCDGQRDCKDGDDEFLCPECGPGELKCPKGGPCVAHNATCDGVSHCPDGWDESGGVCGHLSCGPGELKCLEGGRCVEHQRLCDGAPDCPSAEDEDTTFCSAFNSMKDDSVTKEDKQPVECEKNNSIEKLNCTEEEFQCDNGDCVRQLYVCNGVDDCEMGEDEMPYACVLTSAEGARDDNYIYVPDEDEVDDNEDSKTNDDDSDRGDEDIEPPCEDGESRCDGERLCEKDQNGNCLSVSHNDGTDDASTNSMNNSLILDIPPTVDTQTWSTLDGTDQQFDHNNSPDSKVQASETSTPHSPTTTENSTSSVLSEGDASHHSDTDEGVGIVDYKLEGDKEVNTVSLPTDLENTILDGVDVSIEVVVEESLYPDPDEGGLSSSSVEEYGNTLEPHGVEPLDTHLLSSARNMTNATATDNTTSVLHAPDDLDFNSTIPYLTADDSTSDTSDEYDASSSEEYDSSEEIVNSTSPAQNVLDLHNSGELPDTGSASLEDEEDFSSEEPDTLLNVTATAAVPSSFDTVKTTESVSEGDIPPNNETTVTGTATPVDTDDSGVLSTSSDTPETQTPDVSTETTARNVILDEKSTEETSSTETGVESSEEVVTLVSTEATRMESTPGAVEEATAAPTTTTSALDHESPTTINVTEATTTEVQRPADDKRSTPSTEETSTVTEVGIPDDVESTTLSSTVIAEPDNWKEGPMAQKNLTILIAVHSEMNASKIPQYIIHGMDGSTYEYEIVSIVKDEEKSSNSSSSNTPGGGAGGEGKEVDEGTRKADGSHSYLQGNNISSGERCSLSLFTLILITLLHSL